MKDLLSKIEDYVRLNTFLPRYRNHQSPRLWYDRYIP